MSDVALQITGRGAWRWFVNACRQFVLAAAEEFRGGAPLSEALDA